MNQTDKILRHLRDHGSITPLEALSEYGIMRLCARIWDLKRAGHTITREMVEGKNRYGETWRCWSRMPTNEQREAVKWDD